MANPDEVDLGGTMSSEEEPTGIYKSNEGAVKQELMLMLHSIDELNDTNEMLEKLNECLGSIRNFVSNCTDPSSATEVKVKANEYEKAICALHSLERATNRIRSSDEELKKLMHAIEGKIAMEEIANGPLSQHSITKNEGAVCIDILEKVTPTDCLGAIEEILSISDPKDQMTESIGRREKIIQSLASLRQTKDSMGTDELIEIRLNAHKAVAEFYIALSLMNKSGEIQDSLKIKELLADAAKIADRANGDRVETLTKIRALKMKDNEKANVEKNIQSLRIWPTLERKITLLQHRCAALMRHVAPLQPTE